MRTRYSTVVLASVFLACATGETDPRGRSSGGDGGSGSGGTPEGSSVSSTASSASSAGSGGGGAGGGKPCDYTSPNQCAGAVQMAPVAGDDGADVQTQYGTTSLWLLIRINETKFDPVDQNENPLSYTVTLESPPGMDFDLFVQEGSSDGAQVCGGAAVKGVGQASNESVTSSWNDDIEFGDDKDDHRYLSVEVRYISGDACGADAEWKLTVKGHT